MQTRSVLRFVGSFLLIAMFAANGSMAQTPAKRPMTFADMMKMRRLGDTDVSPDGKWLVYSVTDVDLAQNTRTPKLWIQPISTEKGGGDRRQDNPWLYGPGGPAASSGRVRRRDGPRGALPPAR